MKSRKSQITMLMILGLVLFIAVGFILYVSKSVVKKQSQQSVKKVEDTALEVQPIKEFVQKCLDKLGKDAVILLGKQGGYIYKSQGGTLIDYLNTDQGLFFVKYMDSGVEYKTAYNLVPLRFDIQPIAYAELPLYPWEKFPYEPPRFIKENLNGIFGENKMPPLNPSGGIHSIQSNIESFIDTNMDNCADFNIFEGQGLEIVMEPPKTSVIIGSNDVSIKSKIPITITNPTTKEFVYIEDFSTNIDVRLKRIHSFVYELIENDIRNIRFDIDAPQNDKNSLRVELFRSAFTDHDSDDDIVIVTDEKSLVYGKSYKYIFARKNRAPALYYIKEPNLKCPRDYPIDLMTLLGSSRLEADDPDEDIPTIPAFNIYKGEFATTPLPPDFSIPLNTDKIEFKMEVSDGKSPDYQVITVSIDDTLTECVRSES